MAKVNIAAEVRAVNLALKADSYRVAVQLRGKRLSLVATLPPKPNSTKKKPHQQRISLKLGANMIGLRRAKARALLLADQLERDKFVWDDWIDLQEDEPEQRTCEYWVDRFKDSVWPDLSEDDKEYNWRKRFLYFGFNKLPPQAPLTADALVAAVLTKKESTKAARDQACRQLQRLADFAGIEVDLSLYKAGYSSADVGRRKIPSDDDIEVTIDGIRNPSWRYVFALMATYGLRNHEAMLCTLEDLDGVLVANVPPNTKTGAHVAYPNPARWVERWLMGDRKLPKVKVRANEEYGKRISDRWRQTKAPGKPYDLRHAYAIRCHADGVQVAIAASWMGHSPQMHMSTYQRWISSQRSRQAWDKLQQD